MVFGRRLAGGVGLVLLAVLESALNVVPELVRW
jgi:hypothetical protein